MASSSGGIRSSSISVPTSTFFVVSLSAHEIAQLRCLLAAWDSSPIGSVGFMTDISSTERTPNPHSGTASSWLFGTGVSFHRLMILLL